MYWPPISFVSLKASDEDQLDFLHWTWQVSISLLVVWPVLKATSECIPTVREGVRLVLLPLNTNVTPPPAGDATHTHTLQGRVQGPRVLQVVLIRVV